MHPVWVQGRKSTRSVVFKVGAIIISNFWKTFKSLNLGKGCFYKQKGKRPDDDSFVDFLTEYQERVDRLID